MKMRYLLLILIFLPFTLFSQTSVLQDSKGESAFKVFEDVLTVNAQDKSIAFSFNTLKRSLEKKGSLDRFERLGLNLKINSNEGIANLKNSGGFLIDGELGIYLGRKSSTRADIKGDLSGSAHEWYGSLNLLIDRNKIYDINNPTDDLVYTKASAGWKAEVGKFGYKENLLYGVALNFGQETNVDDLQANTISSLVFTPSASTQIFSEESAYDVSQFDSNRFFTRINADFAYLLNRNCIANDSPKVPPIFATFLFRSSYVNDRAEISPALGIYIGKKGAPRDIVAGVSIQTLDLFNSSDSEDNTWERTIINLTAGFKFN